MKIYKEGITINTNIIYIDMPGAIKAYTACNADGTFTIVLNSRLTHEQHLISYQHELEHIKSGDYDKKCSVDLIEINAHIKNAI